MRETMEMFKMGLRTFTLLAATRDRLALENRFENNVIPLQVVTVLLK